MYLFVLVMISAYNTELLIFLGLSFSIVFVEKDDD